MNSRSRLTLREKEILKEFIEYDSCLHGGVWCNECPFYLRGSSNLAFYSSCQLNLREKSSTLLKKDQLKDIDEISEMLKEDT